MSSQLTPRQQAVLDCIVTYTDAVIELPDELVEELRRALARPA